MAFSGVLDPNQIYFKNRNLKNPKKVAHPNLINGRTEYSHFQMFLFGSTPKRTLTRFGYAAFIRAFRANEFKSLYTYTWGQRSPIVYRKKKKNKQ